MHLSTAILQPLVITLLVIALILFRQMSWRAAERVQRTGVILMIIGGGYLVLGLGGDLGSSIGTPMALLMTAAQLGTGALGGLMLGAVSQIRMGTGEARSASGTDDRPGGAGRVVEIRGGGAGMAVWIAFMALRIAEIVLVPLLTHATIAPGTGMILLSLGLMRLIGARVAVTRRARAAGGNAPTAHGDLVSPR